jgi:hypothetical protein
MKKILLLSLSVFVFSCGDPKGPGEKAGKEANSGSQQGNTNDYDTNKDTTIDMNSGGGTGTDIYKADTLANKGKASGL